MNSNNTINENEAFDELKSLLLEDEMDAFSVLEEKLKKLDFKIEDEQTIISNITPIFDEVLLQRLQHKDAKTQSIFAKYLANIIARASDIDAASLSKSLQSVISPAISKEIEDNKDKMIDALYPIMGGMIAKYVTQAIKEMMETINKKIEQGFSFEGVKRKAKAKLTGVSESELLLEESSDARISSLFVIHKETSMLIAEAHLENKEIDDAHMVASMASAIKDFINDWMQHADTQNEVQLLSYGNATLYIESAGSVFIIAFLDAEPDHEQRTHINTFFASIVKEYARFFQDFDGDDSAEEIVPLSMKMKDYLYVQSTVNTEEKKNPAKAIFVVLGFLLLGYGAYLFQGWYVNHSLEANIHAQTGESVSLYKEDDTLVLEGQVRSIEAVIEIEKLLKRHHYEKLQNNLTVPMDYLDTRFKQLSRAGVGSVKNVEEKLNLLEHSVSSSMDNLNKKVSELSEALLSTREEMLKRLEEKEKALEKVQKSKEDLIAIIQVKNKIFEKLDKTFAGNPYYFTEEHSLDFRKLVLFPPNETTYNIKAIQEVGKAFETYMQVLVSYKPYIASIRIEGHSDSSGLESDNILLSKKRALAVKYYLERLGIVSQYHMRDFLHAEGYGSAHAIIHNGIEDKKASRRIKITFEMNEDEVLKQLKGMTK